jgi:hypothetical protein
MMKWRWQEGLVFLVFTKFSHVKEEEGMWRKTCNGTRLSRSWQESSVLSLRPPGPQILKKKTALAEIYQKEILSLNIV